MEEGLKVVEVEGKGKGIAFNSTLLLIKFCCVLTGVVTTRPFLKGEFIVEYSGELISFKEALKREDEYYKDASVGCYMYHFIHGVNKFW